MLKSSRAEHLRSMDLARVLVVDDNPAARLTLQTLLEACGYRVDAAATAAEAVGKMEDHQYELVLSDMQMESPEAGLRVLAHAQNMTYEPATALITTYGSAKPQACSSHVLVETEDVPDLLTKVTNLLARRVTRQVERQMRHHPILAT